MIRRRHPRRDRHGRPAVHRAAREPSRGSSVTWLGASQRSEGKAYRDAAAWRLAAPLPDDVAAAAASTPRAPGRAPEARLLRRSTPSVAGEIEAGVRRGRPHRRQQRAQLPDGARRAAAHPRSQRRSPGAARRAARRARLDGRASSPTRTARPSCSRWRSRRCASSASRTVLVTTMQAVSGAGYPGVPSLDILGNVDPVHRRRGREDRDARRRRSSARSTTARVEPHPAIVSAQTTRVPVHRRAHRCRCRWRSTQQAVGRGDHRGVRRVPRHAAGAEAAVGAAAAGRRTSHEPNRPQPTLDADRGGGMTRHRRPPAPVPGARLQVRRARPQHDPRRRRRRDAERRADARARAAGADGTRSSS